MIHGIQDCAASSHPSGSTMTTDHHFLRERSSMDAIVETITANSGSYRDSRSISSFDVDSDPLSVEEADNRAIFLYGGAQSYVLPIYIVSQ